MAVGCVYPELTTSPGWRDEAIAGDGGADTNVGGTSNGGNGGKPGSAGTDSEAGARPEPVGGGGEGGAPGPDIIHATVVDQNGQPMAGIPLLIDDLQLETDENGEVSTPGDDRVSFRAVVVAPAAKNVVVYEGLSRRKLHFVVTRIPEAALATGTLQGTITTDAAAQNLSVSFIVPDRTRFFGSRNFEDVAPNVRYDVMPMWDAGTLDGIVQGFNWTGVPPLNAPSAYYFGATPAVLAPNSTVTGLDFTLAALATRALPVTVSVPASATRTDFLLLGPFTVMIESPPASVTYAVPDDDAFDESGAVMQFLTTCTFGGINGASSSVFMPLAASRTSVDEACSLPPELASPANGAVGVTVSTPLTFTPTEEGCNAINVVYVDQGWNLSVFTRENEVVLPDLSAWGVDYAMRSVDWTASTTMPCDSIDSYVQPPTGEPVPTDGPPTTFTRTEHRTFTTAP
jgi:hypothetical protein